MRKSFWRNFFGLSFFLFAISGCGQEKLTNIGSQAPDFTLTEFSAENRRVNLSEINAANPVLLVFWASWCPSCVSEIPELNKWQEQYSGLGLKILAVNVQETPESLKRFTANQPMRYTVLLDETGETAERYGLVGLPASVLLAKGGEILYYGFSLPDIEKILRQRSLV